MWCALSNKSTDKEDDVSLNDKDEYSVVRTVILIVDNLSYKQY